MIVECCYSDDIIYDTELLPLKSYNNIWKSCYHIKRRDGVSITWSLNVSTVTTSYTIRSCCLWNHTTTPGNHVTVYGGWKRLVLYDCWMLSQWRHHLQYVVVASEITQQQLLLTFKSKLMQLIQTRMEILNSAICSKWVLLSGTRLPSTLELSRQRILNNLRCKDGSLDRY